MDNPFQSPALLSLCTGMRGLERGIERVCANVRTLAYVEIEAFIIYNLVAQMEQGVLGAAPVWSDLKTFPAANFHGRIHGITAGYPCQPFSHAGDRKGTEDARHIFPDILRIIKAAEPFWCFFENVSGHISMGYDEVYRSLHSLGYSVEAGIFSAAEAGAPHERERLFILAISDTCIKCFSTATTGPDFNERKQVCKNEFENINGIRTEIVGYDTFNMVHSHISRPKRNGYNKISNAESKRVLNASSTSVFPAPPHCQQQQWEAPRIESRMGCTVNGYNFREDLLRMYGNGVVEQTAEKAFRTLTAKFNINL